MLMRLGSRLIPAKAGPAAVNFGRRATASAISDTEAGASATGGTTTGAMSCTTGSAAAGGAVTPAPRSENHAARPRRRLTDTPASASAAAPMRRQGIGCDGLGLDDVTGPAVRPAIQSATVID